MMPMHALATVRAFDIGSDTLDGTVSKFRISCIYSMECQTDSASIMQEGTPIGEILNLGTMRQHFLNASNEMPWCIGTLVPLDISLGCELGAGLDGDVGLSVYAVPDAGVVALLNL